MKWGFPHFEYRGVVGSMAAFKQHATFGLWKASLLPDPHGLFAGDDSTMGRAKFADVSELPPDAVLVESIRAAVALNEQGVKVAKPRREKKPEAAVPADLRAALRKNKKAQGHVRRVQPESPPGVRGVDHRGEAGGDASAAGGPGRRVAGGRQVAALEVSAVGTTEGRRGRTGHRGDVD